MCVLARVEPVVLVEVRDVMGPVLDASGEVVVTVKAAVADGLAGLVWPAAVFAFPGAGLTWAGGWTAGEGSRTVTGT